MSKTLANLIEELKSEVPAVNSVPTDAQYERAIKDAARAFSRKCGVSVFGELSIVSGTAAYTLDADFLKMIWLEALTGVDGVIVSSGGLIPVSADWEEHYTIVGGQITFVPTPAYTMTREYKYKMAWILTGSDPDETYAEMGDQEAEIVLMKAKSIALEKQELALSASGGMKYGFGAVSVDKGSGTEALAKKSKSLSNEFSDACDEYNGAVLY